jgi:hypothetical protein
MLITAAANRGSGDNKQDSKAHQSHNRNLGVAIDLHIPEQRYRAMTLLDRYHTHRTDRYGRDLQESSHPISKDVDGGTCVVNVGENIAGLTVATMFEDFRIPSSSNMGLA